MEKRENSHMKETAYFLQAILIGMWWVGLSASEVFFNAFQFAGISSVTFYSFFIPDIALIAFLSLVRAYKNVEWLEHVILGAFAYASLFCVNATLLTRSGFLPSGVMFLGLGYNVFLCFSQSFFRQSDSHHLAFNAVKTVVQIVCVWTLALVIVPYIILDAIFRTCLALSKSFVQYRCSLADTM